MRCFDQFRAAKLECWRSKMARPKGRHLPNRVSVALTEQQLAAVQNLALESQAAVAWIIRRAVAEYLERNTQPEGRRTQIKEAGNGKSEHQV
jgi:predicted transcriptional regulator